LLADSEGQLALITLSLERRRCPEGGIERNVFMAIGGPGLDVTPTLTIRVGLTTASTLTASETVQGGINLPANPEFCAGLDFLSPFPPSSVLVLKYILLRGIGGTGLARVRYRLFLLV
jgi:hypothetical protein